MKNPLRRPLVLSLAIGVAVFAIIAAAWQLGRIESWELAAYDALLRARHHPTGPDERIAIIAITEDDLIRYGHPLTDEQLAVLLETVRAAGPRMIGLDLYRDLPEPRAPEPSARLTAALRETENLIAIFKLPDAGGRQVAPPPALADRPERLAFNDFPLDRNVVRRGLLFAPAADGETYPSFALSLAAGYLAKDGIATEQADAAHPEWVRFGRTTFAKFSANDGGYVRAEAGGHQFLLDCKGPQTFTTFSYGDAATGRIPPEALRDRIVLIAADALTVKDSTGTPLSAECQGIVLHAQVINQLLRAALLGEGPSRVLPEWMEAAWCLAWAWAGALVGIVLLHRPWRATLYCAAAAGVFWGVTRAAFFHDWWLPPVAPGLSAAVAAVCSLGLVYFLEKRELGELMQLFSRHVSGTVAKALWQEREKFLDGHRPRSLKLTATVLFTDFVGFSSVSEKMEPEALMDWLNAGMESLASHVEAHGGIINKYIGDAIMAVFGVPIPRTTPEEVARDARSAVRCALAMSTELDALNTRWKSEGRPTIGMRIGIQTGTLVAGCFGSSARLEFTVIGDTVNTASRLESTKKEEIPPPPGKCCRILIGESTQEILGELFETELVGEEALKGKARKVKVFRVVAERIASQPSRLAHTAP